VVTEQIYDGMLQKFVIPREAQDSVIRWGQGGRKTWLHTAKRRKHGKAGGARCRGRNVWDCQASS
jgi:hypothetical protein